MTIIPIQILPGRIAYKDLINAKKEDFAPFRHGEGVKRCLLYTSDAADDP